MKFDQEMLDELNLLSHFRVDTLQEGIKVHSKAGETMVQAAERLHSKGVISARDGGYLTDLGHEVAEHADKILNILSPVASNS